jgi:hypothetical protein
LARTLEEAGGGKAQGEGPRQKGDGVSPRVVLGFTQQLVDVTLLEILGQLFYLITGFGRVLGERLLALLLQLLARLI